MSKGRKNTLEDNIKEVMELADYMASLAMVVGIDIAEGKEEREKANRHIMQLASDKLEGKLRELIVKAYREGYAEAQEYL